MNVTTTTLARRGMQGASLLLVLLLMAVMALGSLAFTRMSLNGVVLSGNTAQKEASLRAAEVGLSDAFAYLTGPNFDPATAALPSYSTTRFASDPNGMPRVVNWGQAASAPVNDFTVAYAIDRQCDAAPPTNPRAQCLVREIDDLNSARFGTNVLPPRYGFVYRATVQVTAPRGTTTFTQGLITLNR